MIKYKVQFVKKLEDSLIKNISFENTLVIYHGLYSLDNIIQTKEIMNFDNFRKVYNDIHYKCFIFFGLNRIINPSNRCDFIFEYLFNLSNDIEKISIDYEPFVGEPWRLWFHYGLTKSGNFGVPYSYSIETEWKHWFYRDINFSRFEEDNLKLCIDSTYSNLDLLSYDVLFYEPDASIFEWYKKAKEFIFNKYTAPKMIINNLLKLVNKKCNVDYNFDYYKSKTNNRMKSLFDKDKIELPDLKIYRFVHEENIRRLNIYNTVIKKGKKHEK